MKVKNIFAVFNGFIHDFFTGYWVAVLITITLLHDFHKKSPELFTPLNSIERFFFWNSIAAIIIIMATGGGRVFTYASDFFGAETEQTRRKMLIIKHIALFLIFGIGELFAWSLAFS